MGWSRKIPFRVDVAGVIHIMGSALYSRPEAAVRELIQNAHDAIMRRRLRDISYRGRIDVAQHAECGWLEFRDDGIGLTADEAEAYLSTLGIGVTGLLKGEHPSASGTDRSANERLIGQFGIGLFSAFMLADEIVVRSRRAGEEGIRWTAGADDLVELASDDDAPTGTSVRLRLKGVHRRLLESADLLEEIVREYADFLPVPIHINGAAQRSNVIHAAWFDPTPDHEAIELALAAHFNEAPMDVVPVRLTRPATVTGALYVTPNRTPGFSGEPLVTVTVLHMAISRRIQDLLPEWASFLRGVLELPTCSPTASREELVRNADFHQVRAALSEYLYEHFERLSRDEPARWISIISWHRYTLAGAALSEPRLLRLLRRTYPFPTSRGPLTFDAILKQSASDPIFETEFDHVVWCNTDRRQEGWINTLFARHSAPCVHALRSFEESLLAALVGEVNQNDAADLRFVAPTAPNFASSVLGVRDLEDVPDDWSDWLSATGARVLLGSFREDQPVLAFLNERHELLRTFDDLKRQGTVPAGFQRLIDAHFTDDQPTRHEVLLNREHRLIARALEGKTTSPLAGVLRLLVAQALSRAGVGALPDLQRQQTEDLDLIADCLWGRD
jgi:molecular chaperone HtpG